MDLLQMCGEEIVRLASARRSGPHAKPIIAGDVIYSLMVAALEAPDSTAKPAQRHSAPRSSEAVSLTA